VTAQTPQSGLKTVDILLIEDQPHDVELVELALKDAGVRHVLHVIPDERTRWRTSRDTEPTGA
jgi:hypothetical protein